MTAIDQNARALLALRDKAGDGAAPPAPPTLDDAYRTQFSCERILAAERGFQPIGWKIGATNAGARAMFKLEAPFLGRLYRQMTSLSPAGLPASAKFYRAYEAEIALVLAADLDAGKGPVDAAAVRAATRAVAPAIEMVGGYVMPGGENFGHALISDFAGNAHWIVGVEKTDFAALDLEQAPIVFSIDGEEKAVGKGANVDGGPFGATAWLANELAKYGRALKAGEYITTGTAIAPFPYAGDGKTAVADFGALGKVEVRIG
ncbi:MAG: hypothetical protein KGM42_17935 [Hyphomicrobiales bacterium]|nr:hypothetical protein [Hyphomicrobiales bacterium]